MKTYYCKRCDSSSEEIPIHFYFPGHEAKCCMVCYINYIKTLDIEVEEIES